VNDGCNERNYLNLIEAYSSIVLRTLFNAPGTKWTNVQESLQIIPEKAYTQITGKCERVIIPHRAGPFSADDETWQVVK
jgi:hypothetical protein